MPDQMMLQIHESIGHPLELDRILGDERNYAGTSFVTPDMFGTYQYGSELLNVTFDPTVRRPARELRLRRRRHPGRAPAPDRATASSCARSAAASLSQARSGRARRRQLARRAGTARRSTAWRTSTSSRATRAVDELIASIEARRLHPHQQLVVDRRLAQQVPVRLRNYRGISANFWRKLAGVGAADTLEAWGTPSCGKGEPNQMIHVGHASPPCVFHDVEVFGGD
jgi:hypothetical protein